MIYGLIPIYPRMSPNDPTDLGMYVRKPGIRQVTYTTGWPQVLRKDSINMYLRMIALTQEWAPLPRYDPTYMYMHKEWPLLLRNDPMHTGMVPLTQEWAHWVQWKLQTSSWTLLVQWDHFQSLMPWHHTWLVGLPILSSHSCQSERKLLINHMMSVIQH